MLAVNQSMIIITLMVRFDQMIIPRLIKFLIITPKSMTLLIRHFRRWEPVSDHYHYDGQIWSNDQITLKSITLLIRHFRRWERWNGKQGWVEKKLVLDHFPGSGKAPVDCVCFFGVVWLTLSILIDDLIIVIIIEAIAIDSHWRTDGDESSHLSGGKENWRIHHP